LSLYFGRKLTPNFTAIFQMMHSKLKKYYLLWILWIFTVDCSAQKENNNWYFGELCGITFNTQPPSALVDGQMKTLEGCATMSNSQGQLLFYTNGVSIWDRTHTVMPNGNGLKGDGSSTQSAVIVPFPDSPHLYYVFTAAAWGNPEGLQYSIVNMNLNGGLGDIVNSRKNIFLMGTICEKLAAIQKPNKSEYWLLALKYESDSLLAYNISGSGIISNPVVSRTGMMLSLQLGFPNFAGAMKISPNGKKVAMAQMGKDSVLLGDFNMNSGVVNNWTRIVQHYKPYGLEFSPTSQYLYVSADNPDKFVFQYDLNSGSPEDITASATGIYFDSFAFEIGALQLGPDGKIYVCIKNRKSISVIHAPDSAGIACRAETNYIPFPYFVERITTYGLPAFVQLYRQKNWITNSDTSICVGDSAQLTCKQDNVKRVLWSNGGAGFSIFVKQAGKYWVTVTDSQNLVFVDTIEVHVGPKFKVYIGPDTAFCGKFSYIINATKGFAKYKWSTGDSNTQITVDSKGMYTIKVLDSNSCPSGDTTIVDSCDALSYHIPTVFTPNNDGLNDYFNVTGANIGTIEMTIYNRWGEKIFESAGKKVSWNGQYKQVPCPESIYIYKLKIKGINPTESAYVAGNLTLLR